MRKLNTLIAMGLVSGAMTSGALANEYADQLTALANGEITNIVSDASVIDAIKAQNAITASYDQAKIDALDTQWRGEVGAGSQPLIEEVLAKPISTYLAAAQDASAGMFTEIFVMDAKGLNVGQSSVTSDYWQGDEGKWQNSYGAGAGSIELGEVELDESSQTFQSQVSIPVLDTDGSVIGAVTVGVNVEYL